MSDCRRTIAQCVQGAVLLLSLATPRAWGQTRGAGGHEPLPVNLGPEARATIERLVDSARTVGLPSAPLVDKVREGMLKGADDRRIVLAVQSLIRELGLARSLLGNGSDVATLSATASALHAGVLPRDVQRLMKAAGDEPSAKIRLTIALVTLVDFVAKRVPPTVAATAIGSLLEGGAADAEFLALRGELDEDILAGRTPEMALRERMRAPRRTPDADATHSDVTARVPPTNFEGM